MTVTLGTDMSLTPQATAQWADQRIKREGSPRGTKGSNPSPSSSESCANCVSASNFTRDGYREDRFAADHLKKIKEVENNGAVVGQSAMWRHYLTNRTSGDMLARDTPS